MNTRAGADHADQVVAPQRVGQSLRDRVTLIAALLLWIAGIYGMEWLIDRSPLEQPISLDPPGVIDTKIWIPLQDRYFLLFEFSGQGYSLQKLRQLIGDQSLSTPLDGVPVTISWSLTTGKTRATVAEGTVVSKGVWAGTYRLVDTIRVEPGEYQFHAKILKPVPQLASLPTRLKLWNDFKTRDTWQSSALFWTLLFTQATVLPLTAFLLLRLAWLYGTRHWHVRMNDSRTSARD